MTPAELVAQARLGLSAMEQLVEAGMAVSRTTKPKLDCVKTVRPDGWIERNYILEGVWVKSSVSNV